MWWPVLPFLGARCAVDSSHDLPKLQFSHSSKFIDKLSRMSGANVNAAMSAIIFTANRG